MYSYRLAASEARLVLPDLDNIAIGVANVAARLTVLSFGSVTNSAPRLRHSSQHGAPRWATMLRFVAVAVDEHIDHEFFSYLPRCMSLQCD